MTDEALLDLTGRMLMIGFEGREFGPELRDLLLDIRPGGIILFKRNVGGGPEQVAGLVSQAQDLAFSIFGRPLLVAIDQEGGPVQRLAPPFTDMPSQRRMAETLTPDALLSLAGTSGRELAAVGINLNLTPVLDMPTSPEATYMAERCFGTDPALVGAMGLTIIDGHAAHGVLTCVKHFPGIGDTRLDPHEELPTVGHAAARLGSMEVMPFAWAIEHGVAGVMSSHVCFPGLDPDGPATYSSKILTDLLRGDLGFEGLLLTDDLEMGAVVKNQEIGSAAVRAVTAGSDLLLICHRPDRIRAARHALLNAVRSGHITVRRLEQSSSRLEEALGRIKIPDPSAWKEVFDIAAEKPTHFSI